MPTLLQSWKGLTRLLARPQRLTCGECERNEKCGLPPYDDCIHRIMQINGDGRRPRRRPTYIYRGLWRF